MGLYVQLNSDNIVVAQLQGATMPQSAAIIDVTARGDASLLGLRYDKQTNSFIDPKPADVRPFASVLLYDPNDKTKTLKTEWMINEAIAIEVTITDQKGAVVTGFSGSFGIPIMRYDPVLKHFVGPPRRLKLDFVSGVATRDFLGFAESGDYGIDDRVSSLAKVAQPLIITVLE